MVYTLYAFSPGSVLAFFWTWGFVPRAALERAPRTEDMPAPHKKTRLLRILDRLEKYYGRPKPPYPTDAYEMVLHRIAGYPQSDANCDKGFAALKKQIGLSPKRIPAADPKKLAAALSAGGIVPELRAQRLREVAARVDHEFGGDLRKAVHGPLPDARKALKKFPTLGDSGAEKILLFTSTAPVAAMPANGLRVPLRLGYGRDSKNYAACYKSVQEAVRAELPETCEAQIRAYLLLKQHAYGLCGNSRPKCEDCPVTDECRYFAATRGA
jgi:endonuclease III